MWQTLDDRLKDLTTQAAIAMQRNADTLRKRGFNVVLVPGLPPRLTDDERVYYPTLMNALVRSNGTAQQVLVPSYAGYYPQYSRRRLTS